MIKESYKIVILFIQHTLVIKILLIFADNLQANHILFDY